MATQKKSSSSKSTKSSKGSTSKKTRKSPASKASSLIKKKTKDLKKQSAKLQKDVQKQKKKVTAKVKKLINKAEKVLAPLHEEDFTASEILRKIREALTPTHLNLKNLSAAHKNHPEAKKSGGGHYSLSVVSELFSGLDLKSRQRWVMNLLSEQMGKAIHALQMELRSPEEVTLSKESGAPLRRDLKIKPDRSPSKQPKEKSDDLDTEEDDF